MRKVMVISLVGGVLLLSGALAHGANPIEVATKFLVAWGKGNWDDLATMAGPTVTVTGGGQEAVIDVAGKRAGAVLVFPFKGLSVMRVDGAVKGVTVDEMTVKVGSEEKMGRGVLTIEDKDGKSFITKVSIE